MIELNGIQISDNNINTRKNVKIYVDEKQLGNIADNEVYALKNEVNALKNAEPAANRRLRCVWVSGAMRLELRDAE